MIFRPKWNNKRGEEPIQDLKEASVESNVVWIINFVSGQKGNEPQFIAKWLLFFRENRKQLAILGITISPDGEKINVSG